MLNKNVLCNAADPNKLNLFQTWKKNFDNSVPDLIPGKEIYSTI